MPLIYSCKSLDLSHLQIGQFGRLNNALRTEGNCLRCRHCIQALHSVNEVFKPIYNMLQPLRLVASYDNRLKISQEEIVFKNHNIDNSQLICDMWNVG